MYILTKLGYSTGDEINRLNDETVCMKRRCWLNRHKHYLYEVVDANLHNDEIVHIK